ncbi:hypothetical protein J8V57_07330 [Xenorhabdus sp. PB61.4]|uniref:hypothetical protein n=1 Tax=Xenorhabdus sp. PB61.4 TaxID=2788940 RepID=UPI001E3F84C7|nr:hypothetical protein [Xenorhabdus sp. PB61.4]MCC8366094.1 hypothetical protein [Xenorhabdus sp. PB61.4]
MKKINLYAMLFFIITTFFHNSSAIDLDKNVIVPYKINNQDKPKGKPFLVPPSSYYNLTIKNASKYDKLNLYRNDDHCMYNSGEKSIDLQAGDEKTEQIEIRNSVFSFPVCSQVAKSISWTATTYFNNKEYKSCYVDLTFSYNPFALLGPGMGWFYHVDTKRGCGLEVSVDCGGNDCLNNDGTPITNDYNITITIKDDKNWESSRITSPKSGTQLSNNYTTILGKGLNKDGSLPEIYAFVWSETYPTRSTGDGDNWMAQIWWPCYIKSDIQIKDVVYTTIMLYGPWCGATITSMQDGQTIPAGKYSLSGLVNSDTIDESKRMQVKITGYNRDGSIYLPTKNYTPTVDTNTGRWSLEDIEAVCSIKYKASSSVSSGYIDTSGMPGLPEVNYSVQSCPAKITSPKPNSTVGNNYITVSGTGRTEDGSWPELVTSFDSNSYSTQPTGDGDNWTAHLWMPCGITGTVSISGMGNSGVTFNGPICGETITSMQDGQIIPPGKYSLSGRINSDTADDEKHMQVQITGYNRDGSIYSPAKSYTPNVDTDTGEWSLEGLEAVCSINYKVRVSDPSSELQATHQSLLPGGMPGKKEVSYSTQACSVKITKPEKEERVSSGTENTQNIPITGTVNDGISVYVSYGTGASESSQSPASFANGNWSYEAQDVPMGFITIKAVGKDPSGNLLTNENDEVVILSSKIFSVVPKYDGVFTEFSGTAMPTIDHEEIYLNVEVEISLDVFGYLKTVESDENGDWKYGYNNYANRGEYIFTFEEISDDRVYKSRGEKMLKCTGSDRGMDCIAQN